MSRSKLVIRPRKLTICLPGDVAAKLETFLTSTRTGTVPQGAYQRFFTEAIHDFFAKIETAGNQLMKEIDHGDVTGSEQQAQPAPATDGAGE
jgi:hypothetical protein